MTPVFGPTSSEHDDHADNPDVRDPAPAHAAPTHDTDTGDERTRDERTANFGDTDSDSDPGGDIVAGRGGYLDPRTD